MLEYQFSLTETVDIPAVIGGGGGGGWLEAININKSPTGISARSGLVHQNCSVCVCLLDINCPGPGGESVDQTDLYQSEH